MADDDPRFASLQACHAHVGALAGGDAAVFALRVSADAPQIGACGYAGAVHGAVLEKGALRSLGTPSGAAKMAALLDEAVGGGGCALVIVPYAQAFAHLRLLRALLAAARERAWTTHIDGEEGMYSRVLVLVSAPPVAYALPFQRACAHMAHGCIRTATAWNKLWAWLPPCAEVQVRGCPLVPRDGYAPPAAGARVARAAVGDEAPRDAPAGGGEGPEDDVVLSDDGEGSDDDVHESVVYSAPH